MIELILPTNEEAVRELKAGDQIGISGTMFTGRDAALAYLSAENREEFGERLRGGILYHCGPVVSRTDGEWRFLSAGPTTSMRGEPFQAAVFERYGLRGALGKGGMGGRTEDACRERGAVYLNAVGGAGALYAGFVKRVRGVYLLEEFGTAEAIWEIEVEGFPAMVTIDSRGRNIHREVRERSEVEYRGLMGL